MNSSHFLWSPSNSTENTQKSRILILAPDTPFLPMHGGKIDILNIAQELSRLGHKVLLCGFSRKGSANFFPFESLDVHRKTIVVSTFLRPFIPYQASSRTLNRNQLQVLEAFRPQIVISFQEWTGPAMWKIRKVYNGPLILRRTNDEGEYLQSLIKSSSGLRSIYYTAEKFRLLALNLIWNKNGVTEIWDIADGIVNNLKVPKYIVGPITSTPVRRNNVQSGKRIIHVGSLDLPHAVEGLRWFICIVWPLVRTKHPDAILTLAGRNPSKEIQNLSKLYRFTLIPNPVNADELLADQDIFINPIFSGSGVNIKMLVPASIGIPIVTTSFGLRGLRDFENFVKVADEPIQFENAINQIIVDRIRAEANALTLSSVVKHRNQMTSGLMDKRIIALVASPTQQPDLY